ncbi:MAG: glutathione synthase [Gammaproteobacteria bacterium]
MDTIYPKKDSTLAMMREAQSRGWRVQVMELGDLYLRDGLCHGRMRALTLQDDDGDWYRQGPCCERPLHELAVVLMRKDPPIDMEYIYATHLLELAESRGVRVVNSPRALRDINEKLYTAWFPQCTPPTLVTRDGDRLRDFLAEQGDIIIKPLDAMGGESVFRVTGGNPNINVIIEVMTERGRRFAMAQRYIPEISAGDKRILLVDGEPMPYALARIPAPGETRANLASGGQGVGVALSERDRWICAQVGPVLRERGLLFVGLDVIGDYLTEINVTSPTCIRELDQLYGLDISARLMDRIEALLP